MRYVNFDPEALSGEEKTFWTAWVKRSRKARDKAFEQHSQGKEIRFNSNVWKELKDWLLEHVFYGKCAYCEGRYTAGTHDAAEHWRPKGKVTQNDQPVKNSNGEDHPGYWWLAYDWRNLVPACDLCNGEPGGKMNEFPVGESHCFDENKDFDELDQIEDPLLLHPYASNDKPEENLKFGLQGVVAEDESSQRGVKTIKICNLSRSVLNEDRAEEQEKSRDRFLTAIRKLYEEQIPINVTMDNFTGPKGRYSQSVKAYIEIKKEWLREQLLR